jgi:HEPN domain-containing protein
MGKQVDFLRELSTYYIPSRYPEEVTNLRPEAKEEKAPQVLGQWREFMEWLKSILP